MPAQNNLRNFTPALEEGFKLLLEDLDPTDGVAGAVIAYDATAGAWVVYATPALPKYEAKYSNAGGSATVTISVPGVLSTDKVFAQIESSANGVSIYKVTPSTNTITILCSGDPGASVITYRVDR